MKSVLCAGYFGCGNIGDDAILLGFIEGCRGLPIEIATLSGRPDATYRNYGISAYQRKDLKTLPDVIAKHDALVFPGGSIFQDVTSIRTVPYYAHLVSLAKKAGKKVYLLGQGVGPLKGFIGKSQARKAFESADAITLRDADSVNALKALGVKKTPRACADMALLMPTPQSQDGPTFEAAGMKSVGLIPRPHGKGKEVEELFVAVSRAIYDRGYIPTLVEMDEPLDGPLIQAIDKVNGGKIPSMRHLQTPMDFQRRLMRMECVISMRLHGGILSMPIGVPSVLLSYDPKVSSFAKEAGLPAALPMQGITPDRVIRAFEEALQNREKLQAQMAAAMPKMQQMSRVSIDVFRESMGL